MKKHATFKRLAIAAVLMLLAARTAQALDQTKADNSTTLNLGGSWVSGTAPNSTGFAIWNGAYTPSSLTNSLATSATWGGIVVSNVSGAPTIYTTGSGSLQFNGVSTPSGVIDLDMSQATVDFTLGTTRVNENSTTTTHNYNVPAGRTFTFGNITSPWAWNINSGSSAGAKLAFNGAGNYVFTGQFYDNNPGVGVMIFNGPGTVTLANANYVSNWALNGGTLNLNSGYALSGYANPVMVINGGTINNTTGAALTLNSNPRFIWTGNFAFAGTTNLSLGGGPVTLSNSPNVQVTVVSNTLTVGGVIDDGGYVLGMTKAGAGQLTISTEDTYTGPCIISGGTLALTVNGWLDTPTIEVGSNATFDCSLVSFYPLSIGGASTSGTGTIYVGLSILNVQSNLIFQADGVGGTVGNVNVTDTNGNVVLNNNTVSINVTGSPLGASTNTLMTVEGTLNNSANPAPVFTGVGLKSGCVASVISTVGSPGEIDLVVTNRPQNGQITTNTLARTTGTSPIIYGDTLILTATVTGASTSPAGNVVFKNGSTMVATVALTPGTSPTSTAAYTNYPNVAGSPYSFAAYYMGDATHNVSDSSASPILQTIAPKSLTVYGISAASTAYDGTTNAKLTGTAYLNPPEAFGTGSTNDLTPYNGDILVVGGAVTGTLDGKDVGSHAVTVLSVTMGGPAAANYTLVQPQGLVQTVTPKALTVTGLTVTNKNADGTTTAGFTTNSLAALQTTEAGGAGATSDGKPYTGDAVSLTGTPVATFAQTNAANNIAVTVTGLSLTGTNVFDYTLTSPSFTASIIGGPPGDQIRADNSGYDLQTGYSWVSGATPDSTNWAIWTGSYQSANLSDSLGGNVIWGGIMVSNVSSPANGGPIDINGNYTLSLNGVSTPAGVMGIDMSHTTNNLTLDTGRMNLLASQTWNVATNATLTFARNQSPYAFNLNGGVGSWNLILNGAGTYNFIGNIYDDAGNAILTINGPGTVMIQNQSYHKHTVLNGGLLVLNAAGAVNTGLTINGGSIDNQFGAAITMSATTIALNGDFTFLGSNNLGLGGTGAETLGGNRTITVNAGTLTIGGAIGDGGHNYSLTKAGAGTLTLSGANTYSGDTTVNGGTLVVAQARLATNSTITVANGTVLSLTFAATVTNTVGNLVLNGVVQPAGVYNSGNTATYITGTGNLLVQALATPSAANITYAKNGSQLVLNWPTGQGWQLQAQTNSLSTGLTTNWVNVAGATPPYTNNIIQGNPSIFYRLIYPY